MAASTKYDCFEADAPLEQVTGFLHKYGLWAPLSEEALYKRYSRFSKVTFECIPEAQWGRYMQDLL